MLMLDEHEHKHEHRHTVNTNMNKNMNMNKNKNRNINFVLDCSQNNEVNALRSLHSVLVLDISDRGAAGLPGRTEEMKE
jgi:hypothetical protein